MRFHPCTTTFIDYFLLLLKVTGYQECYLFFKLILNTFFFYKEHLITFKNIYVLAFDDMFFNNILWLLSCSQIRAANDFFFLKNEWQMFSKWLLYVKQMIFIFNKWFLKRKKFIYSAIWNLCSVTWDLHSTIWDLRWTKWNLLN